jgi:hypothetical protein
MKLRIAIWAAAGALVVVIWRFCISATFPNPLLGTARVLIDLTCPIALVRHHAMSFYSVLLVNAGTYALLGVIVEIVRQQHKRSHGFQMNHAN